MGTVKRERQKVNRQEKLQEMARQARRDKTRRRTFQIVAVVGGSLVLLFGLAYLFSDDSNDALPSPAVSTVDPAATIPADTIPADTIPADTIPASTVAREFSYGTGPCPEADGSTAQPDTFEDAPKLCIDPTATFTAEVVTNKGPFTIALDPASSPGSVNNFVVLSRYGYYDGTGCHRVIADFVVQCGRPGGDEQLAEASPGYTIPDESPSGAYEEGMIVMANTGQPDSGGGQWFVITGAQGAALPPQYSIIGKVTEGFDTTVKALANLADPTAANGVPPLVPIEITSVTITEV